MPPSSKTSAGTQGNILLLEGYDALAAAIASALKKFAPHHAILTARSPAAAEEIAAKTRLDLLLIDFDPPLPGLLESLGRLRTHVPDARALIIASGMPSELLRARRQPTALGFIEKPFQLAEFGAAVKALLSEPAAGAAPHGALRDLNLGDVIPLLGLEGATGSLKLKVPGKGRHGEVHFARGRMQHAAARGLTGVDALRDMMSWTSPVFAMGSEDFGATRSLHGPWPTILGEVLQSMPSLQETRPRASKLPRLSPAPGKVKPRPTRTGKKVLVIDDTETLRVFVEEMLSTTDPEMQIVTAATAEEGLKHSATLHPDLILLDYSLPDFNGDEVCRRLLENTETSNIPVIMMSGHVAQMSAAFELYDNITLTLSKPFLSGALIDAVVTTLADPRPLKRRQTRPLELPAPAVVAAEPPPVVAKAEHAANGKKPVTAAVEVVAPPMSSEPGPEVEEPSPLPPVTATEVIVPPPIGPAPIVPAPDELTPARIRAAAHDAVVVNIPLEVLSMQFSPALQITAIRARPCAATVSLRVDPRALPAVPLPETAFEIARVDLDGRGQIQTMHVSPAAASETASGPRAPVAIERLAVLPTTDSAMIQFVPTPATMNIRLLAAFDLAGVQLSSTFGLSGLALHARGGRLRVILPGDGGKSGATFETAQVLLDRSGRIAEVLLDSVVP